MPTFMFYTDGFLTFAINKRMVYAVGCPLNPYVVLITNFAGLGGSKDRSPKYNKHFIRLSDILFTVPHYLQSKYLYDSVVEFPYKSF
jgi:hypothetical protein